MNKEEWSAKLEEWAFGDARLHRMPLALLPILAEHLANHEAAQNRMHGKWWGDLWLVKSVQRCVNLTLAIVRRNQGSSEDELPF